MCNFNSSIKLTQQRDLIDHGDTQKGCVMKSLENRIPPPILVVLFMVAMGFAAPLTPEPWLDAAWRWGLSLLFGALGLLVAIAGVREFARAKTTINPVKIDAASSLVTSGIFSYTRNPMYLGMTLMLIGWALFLNSLGTVLGPLLFALFITRFQIIPEERVMDHKFGDVFAAYRQTTRRWL